MFSLTASYWGQKYIYDADNTEEWYFNHKQKCVRRSPFDFHSKQLGDGNIQILKLNVITKRNLISCAFLKQYLYYFFHKKFLRNSLVDPGSGPETWNLERSRKYLTRKFVRSKPLKFRWRLWYKTLKLYGDILFKQLENLYFRCHKV